MRLSKSLYTRGLQCVKSLWLKKYDPDKLTPPDSAAEAIFETGNQVGDLACELFPGGREVPYEGSGFEEKIALTKQWMDEGVRDIYEASFEYDGIFIMVDILHINEDTSVEIYEVKSSTDVKDVYLHDVSIQFYVLAGLGYTIKCANVVHINNQYVRGEELDIHELFTIVDVTETVLEMQENIPSYLAHFEGHLSNKEHAPNVDIGPHCSDPYDCDARAHCWQHIPEYSIFDISRLNKNKKFDLYRQGIVHFEDISDVSAFSANQQLQITAELEQREIIDQQAIRNFLNSIIYPVYHLDFETFQQAIPQWPGLRPFEQIPFQYSVHIQHKDGRLEHREHLAKEGEDPRRALAEALVADIPEDVMVLAYNMGFEKGVIKRLAALYDDLAPHLMAIHDNIQDLMLPFQKKAFYDPKMRGSYSIKQVLPALVPEMEKAYKELDLVHHGGEAMQAFAQLVSMEDPEHKKRMRQSLQEYCKLDTLAMVKILEKLKEVV